MKIYAVVFLMAFSVHAELIISEVFGNRLGNGADMGYEWVELYNPSDAPQPLSGLSLVRYDTVAEREGFRVDLPENTTELLPHTFVIIAQSADLGTGKCLDLPVIVVTERHFFFKNSGIQKLCVQSQEALLDCAHFSSSSAFQDGHSRMRLSLTAQTQAAWGDESCEVTGGFYATPGFGPKACEFGDSFHDVLYFCVPDKPSVEEQAPPEYEFVIGLPFVRNNAPISHVQVCDKQDNCRPSAFH